jgi:hypothetical protein
MVNAIRLHSAWNWVSRNEIGGVQEGLIEIIEIRKELLGLV